MKTPMQIMLESIEWKRQEGIYSILAVHAHGSIDLGKFGVIKCFKLSDGQIVIEANDLEKLMGTP